jgi:hypothetical protein
MTNEEILHTHSWPSDLLDRLAEHHEASAARRNPARIDEVLKVLGEAWRKDPDLRLGQLISNLSDTAGIGDAYQIEDDLLLEALRQWTAPEPREWEIWVCPTCGGLPEHLGGGVQGCGRHTGTTYHRGAGVWPPDGGPNFIQVKVREVTR